MRLHLACLLLAACSSTQPYTPDPLITARPYDSNVPSQYDGQTPMPLVLLLHGYSAGPFIQDAYFGMTDLSNTQGFLLAEPKGTPDKTGALFWNATDACCAGDTPNPPDDVAYLNAVIADMRAQYKVDERRIYIVGHSNGGYMAHRLACETGGTNQKFAAIVSLAGAVWLDASKCNPQAPISILQVHGTADKLVLYDGAPDYPSAHGTVQTWAQKNGCSDPIAPTGMTYDLDMAVTGAETSVEAYGGCARGDVQLWTMTGSGHVPSFFLPKWGETFWTFLAAHPFPASE